MWLQHEQFNSLLYTSFIWTLSRLTFPVMKKQDVPNTFKRQKRENNINGKFSKDAPLFSDDSLVKSIIVWDIFH